jgi:hypothetical protein
MLISPLPELLRWFDLVGTIFLGGLNLSHEAVRKPLPAESCLLEVFHTAYNWDNRERYATIRRSFCQLFKHYSVQLEGMTKMVTIQITFGDDCSFSSHHRLRVASDVEDLIVLRLGLLIGVSCQSYRMWHRRSVVQSGSSR